ncbi:uncharacterized protein BO97DRAFT_461876 [Aspergillus homomorphus CBS 101889]|uniref:Uncharacterized protein n=1 Tax=Aspergillus homomorphus (strain CBS 101889) TaxID=1450537 RepID=A0A395HL43_ASPHC|nr:hypothetical protein BO97DRAFT_461876 [Aspergillus homomorphus CBS 101889]RAL08199.1 hypothetical protein BO97DRAFT_461876 [Aspergillus homomorphus CBS 101889]
MSTSTDTRSACASGGGGGQDPGRGGGGGKQPPADKVEPLRGKALHAARPTCEHCGGRGHVKAQCKKHEASLRRIQQPRHKKPSETRRKERRAQEARRRELEERVADLDLGVKGSWASDVEEEDSSAVFSGDGQKSEKEEWER